MLKVVPWLRLPFLTLVMACPSQLRGQAPRDGAPDPCSTVYDQTTVLGGNNIRTLLTNRGTVSAPSETVDDLVWKRTQKGQGFEFGLLAAGSVSPHNGKRYRIVSDGPWLIRDDNGPHLREIPKKI